MITHIGNLDLSRFVNFKYDINDDDDDHHIDGIYYSPYKKILFDMINKNLDLGKSYAVLDKLARMYCFRYDIYDEIFDEIYDEIYKKNDKNFDETIVQDFFQILYNGTHKFYDYFDGISLEDCECTKNKTKRLKKLIENIKKSEDEIIEKNNNFKIIY
jgi:hypothetical protein